MTKNPYINALCAGLYIVFIVLLLTYGTTFVKDKPDTILAPMAMLSLLVFSAAFMGYLFFFQPVLMYLDGHKREAIALFTRTLASFAVVTALVVAAAFLIAPEEHSLVATATYSCDKGRTITAAFYDGPTPKEPAAGEPPVPTGLVKISFDGGPSITLPQAISADGSRYAKADESLVFWNKGNTVLIMRGGSMDLDYTNCATQQ